MAALIEDQDDTQYHGDLAFVGNERLRWLAMRDVPRGHFPGCRSMNRRDVAYVNSAVAELRHGLPVIDFTRHLRDAVDFRFFPFGVNVERDERGHERRRTLATGDVLNSDERPREFAVLNRMSQLMTRFAFAGLDGRCQPVRPRHFRLRPGWMWTVRWFKTGRPRELPVWLDAAARRAYQVAERGGLDALYQTGLVCNVGEESGDADCVSHDEQLAARRRVSLTLKDGKDRFLAHMKGRIGLAAGKGSTRATIPMQRLLFTILSALSLLLCVAVCVLWVREHSR